MLQLYLSLRCEIARNINFFFYWIIYTFSIQLLGELLFNVLNSQSEERYIKQQSNIYKR